MTYLDPLADRIQALLPDDLTPPDDSDSLFRLYAVLARVKGEQCTLEDVHDAWVLWMQERGETHESMVPFADLDPTVQAEDAPFLEAIRAASREIDNR